MKSLFISCLFLVGTAFLFTTHAARRDNFAGLVALHKMHSKEILTEGARMMSLPITGEARTSRLRVGLWGGEHIRMDVTETGATIEYDCAHGTIEQRITLDRRGWFNVSGKQAAEHGGPVRQNEELAGDPVRFSGQVNGKTMKLTVRNTVTKELVGIFTLVYGADPKLRKCR